MTRTEFEIWRTYFLAALDGSASAVHTDEDARDVVRAASTLARMALDEHARVLEGCSGE